MARLWRWALPLGTGSAYVALAVATARGVGALERGAVEELNEDDEPRPLLRIPQQAGTPWMLPGLAALAWWRDQHRIAIAAAAALPLEKAAEVVTKKLSGRPRPARVDGDVRLRDDAPADGPSYPSGHAAIAACAVTLATRWLGPWVSVPAGVLALGTGAARVHQGAHFPGDVLGGALLGVTVGSALDQTLEMALETALDGTPGPRLQLRTLF